MDTTPPRTAGGAVEIANRTTVRIDGRRVALVAPPRPVAPAACLDRCDVDAGPEAPDLRVAFGGDGCVLRAMQLSAVDGAVCFGGNCGHVGFLANPAVPDDGRYRSFADGLAERLEQATVFDLAVLVVVATTATGPATGCTR